MALRRSSDILNRKVPPNPRYKNVKPVVDSGSSLRRYLEAMEEMRRNFKYRKDEVFKRIKLSTFISLVIEVARMKRNEEYGAENGSSNGNHANGGNISNGENGLNADTLNNLKNGNALIVGDTTISPREKIASAGPKKSARHTLQSVISGLGELDIVNNEAKEVYNSEKQELIQCGLNNPYLLLDVRDFDEYSQCHIITAKNYPVSRLSRTMDFETKDLLQFKNQSGKIIILYDDDEIRAAKVATTLTQRGYENTFMLSGGLKHAAEKFPRGLITGNLPASCKNQQSVQRPTRTGRRNSIGGQSVSSATSVSNLSISANSNAVQLQDDFAIQDLELLETYLQDIIIPNNTPGRLGSAVSVHSINTVGTRSAVGSARSGSTSAINKVGLNQNLSATGRARPWK